MITEQQEQETSERQRIATEQQLRGMRASAKTYGWLMILSGIGSAALLLAQVNAAFGIASYLAVFAIFLGIMFVREAKE